MSGERPVRYFTVEEARALVPRLRALLTALRTEKQQLDAEARALAALTPRLRANGYAPEAARHERRINELVEALRRQVRQITELGVVIKDINAGLVDFPSLRDGRTVYLCWRVDEPTVEYWHEIDAGFIGRQPLE